jgi:hypothetical protein
MLQFHEWLVERMDLNKEEFVTREDIENEVYRLCLDCIAEGNKEEANGYWDNLNDEYSDYERDYKKQRETTETKVNVVNSAPKYVVCPECNEQSFQLLSNNTRYCCNPHCRT